MRMKLLSVTISALLVGGFFASDFVMHSNHVQASASISSQKVVSLEAAHKKYKDLKELEKKSDFIVKIKFTGDRTTHNWESDGEIVESASKSEVEVLKDFKGDLKKGKTISVYEPGYFHEDIYVNIEGYELMEPGEEYLLFLRSIENDDTLMLVGMYQGKYKLDKDTDKNLERDNNEHYEKLKVEVKGKYTDKN